MPAIRAEGAVRKPALIGAEPPLFVAGIERSVAFFTERLGFDVAFRHGEPVFYAQVRRDDVCLNLRHADCPVFDTGFRTREQDARSAMITVDEAEALYREFLASGVTFHKPLVRESWGSDVFISATPTAISSDLPAN